MNGLGALYAFYCDGVADVCCGLSKTDEGVFSWHQQMRYTLILCNLAGPLLTFDPLTSRSTPLSCIFCCPIVHDGYTIVNRQPNDDPIVRLQEFFYEYFFSARHRARVGDPSGLHHS